MAATTTYLRLGEQVARQTLVEKPPYTTGDHDLDASFFPEGVPAAPAPEPITFRSQYLKWIDGLKNRACDPVSVTTLVTFESRAKTILSVVGPSTLLESFKNAAMAQFVKDTQRFGWSPATLASHILVIKLIIASATNEEGEPMFTRTWNRRVINAPSVDTTKQKRFIFTREQIETLLRESKTEQERVWYATLAGTGLRLGEARSIRVRGSASQSTWEPGKIVVRNSLFRNEETGRTKTEAGTRTVYLHSSLNQMIADFVAHEKREAGSLLFQSKNGQPMKASTIADRLTRIIPDATIH